VDRSEPVSREVSSSLQLAPVPWELRNRPNPSVTEDAYWKLPREERAERQRRLNAIPQSWSDQKEQAGPPIYEALQPPLYYWLLSIPYRALKHTSLLNRVFLLRYFSLFITSSSIPLVFLIARRVVGGSAFALGISALLAVTPELMVDVCRVGNECLGIVLYSWLTLLCLDLASDVTSRSTGLWIGIALGLGLITKVYFLTAVPALAILYFWRFWRTKKKFAILYQAVVTFGCALLIAGWWYGHNRITTGTWSGLSESVKLLHFTPQQYLAGIWQAPWGHAIDSILVSHIWHGGWSSLGLRSWMYHLFFGVAAMASLGIASVIWRSKPVPRSCLYPLMSLYGWFWAGQLYNVLLLFLSKGVATSMGWYMYCVVAAEAILLVVGLQALASIQRLAWVLPALIVCVAAVDLYSIHFVSIPYYVGLIGHQQSGSVAAFHVDQLHQIGLSEVFRRLSVNKAFWLTPFALAMAWSCYVAALAVLIGVSLRNLWKYRSRA
jgi:4-amino-4-deoxy-L-arabinose transferase-like glycosyltransferase